LPSPTRFLTILAPVLLGAACKDQPDPPPADAASPAQGLLPAAEFATGCGDGGELDVTLYGALEGPVRWGAGAMSCEGMPRPDGAGARLRFAGQPDGGPPLAIIIGIPGLTRGATGTDLASNVTIIEEGAGRFFSTTNLDTCWTDVDGQDAVDDAGRFAVRGRLICISPLPEVNGAASVTLGELRFQGFIDWESS